MHDALPLRSGFHADARAPRSRRHGGANSPRAKFHSHASPGGPASFPYPQLSLHETVCRYTVVVDRVLYVHERVCCTICQQEG